MKVVVVVLERAGEACLSCGMFVAGSGFSLRGLGKC